jgi:hypothetical protein
MAFNEEINSNGGNENWRILWAYSSDGQNWTVDNKILFVNAEEATTTPQIFCGAGFLLTDMFIADSYFYITFTDVSTDALYLARALIDAPGPPGYGTWSIASYPIVNNNYSWRTINTTCPPSPCLGQQLDLYALDAVSILPSRTFPLSYQVKQASIGRVFDAQGTTSAYYALTRDDSPSGEVVELWKTTSLTTPFAYDSTVNMRDIVEAHWGWEFGFTHYADNWPGGTPRIRRQLFDFWVTQKLDNTAIGDPGVTRRQVQLSPLITAPTMTSSQARNLTATAGRWKTDSGQYDTISWNITGGSVVTTTNTNLTSTLTFNPGSPGTTTMITATETQPDSSCPPSVPLVGKIAVQVDFADVPATDPFRTVVDTLARNGVTAGCGGGNYCPTTQLTRAQMAVFLIKGKHGSSYSPPPATGTLFSDVSADSFGAAFIEEQDREQIMTSCSAPPCVFGPTYPVYRADMAHFLLKAQRYKSWGQDQAHGYAPFFIPYVPPQPTQYTFVDVQPGNPDAAWIYQLVAEGIAVGCSTNPPQFCPGVVTTRAQMAAFIDATFKLQ